MTLHEVSILVNRKIEVKTWQDTRKGYQVMIKNLSKIEGGLSIGSYGTGSTIHDAIVDYCKILSGSKVSLDYGVNILDLTKIKVTHGNLRKRDYEFSVYSNY